MPYEDDASHGYFVLTCFIRRAISAITDLTVPPVGKRHHAPNTGHLLINISRTMIIRRVVCLKKCFIERKFSRSAKITWDAFLRNNNGGTSLKKFVVEHYDIAKAILENTEITRNHLTPEVKLFLLTENCPLYYESFHENGKFDSFTRNMFQDSFWSVYWPGGQALTRFIFDEKNEILKNKNTRLEAKRDELRILDLGAGCGATAIAAKLTIGSCKIVANDINKVACVAIAMNAMLNNVDIEVSWANLLTGSPEQPYDLIFVGDLLYDEEMANNLITWLEKAHTRGARIYLGDPGRHGLTENFKKRMRLLKRYFLPENVRKENYGYDTATVWEFQQI
ncbi:electron transfer flavoprotein beta subunit lysine methyltransferase-like [Pseudomyrmex gracilis]|uniref:electron transfer flavoprotein beta subunit lysine methyltransferase-like n=1 Tax=Pseudomyrmex gracilis TaxID=219809 RepID=UPI000994EE23|nr:electron transfer flavoprotein beta subunit lysine methyltransferase-like [Pseudomyrmex gracilis]XP_020277988.1 electron transfer flavoprotein beta subunit lysine methyltransferase-like [Pseudomyrmex gracilis]